MVKKSHVRENEKKEEEEDWISDRIDWQLFWMREALN